MGWMYLITAGILEIGWPVGLKMAQNEQYRWQGILLAVVLMFASGVGANGNSTLGTGAVGGMLIGMICQIFVVPALFVAFVM